jgi:hypothetical protein
MSGDWLGVVGSVLNGRLEVVTPSERLWLVDEVVFEAGFGRVALVCERRGLSRYAYRTEAGV